MYPYHLGDVMVKGLRITAFDYYLDIFIEMLKNEKSYDSLPNFTACDGAWPLTPWCSSQQAHMQTYTGLLVLGIGRNEYIDLMNQCRSKVRVCYVSLSHSHAH